MSSTSNQRSFTHYAGIGVVLAIVFAFNQYSDEKTLDSLWEILIGSDFGNAIAALVAVGGYLLETYNARKAQQLEAQIERVNSQSRNLLVPITTQFHSMMMGSTLAFIDKHIQTAIDKDSGKTNKEMQHVCQKKLDLFLGIRNMTIEPTNLQNPTSIGLFFDHIWNKELMKPNILVSHELPEILYDLIIECAPGQQKSEMKFALKPEEKSKIWNDYEKYIKNEFVPAVQRIAEIIDEHGSLMEPVPMTRLKELFGSDGPGHGWKWEMAPRMWFYSIWLAYARSWQTTLSNWDDDDYSEIRPNVQFPNGMLFFNIEAQSIVANVEKELVGMSQMHGHSSNR